jgi:hypothetical protein
VPGIPSFTEYLASLGRLTAHADPTAASPGAAELEAAADSLGRLDEVTAGTLATWAGEHAAWVIDGIGWKNRVNDLRRIYALWERNQIDGMYTLTTLDRFRVDLQQAARLRGLLPPGS